MTIFMGKIVDILNLPSNYLLITKSEILYKKGKKQFTFKISEIKYEFHSFFEEFDEFDSSQELLDKFSINDNGFK